MSISLTNFATIKGYDAGKNGNLLVSVVPKLAPMAYAGAKGKEHKIRQLIVTATLDDEKLMDVLMEKVDEFTSMEKIILVSKEFMRLPRKQKLALLEMENLYNAEHVSPRLRNNLREAGVDEVSCDGYLSVKTAAIEKYGRRSVKKAEKKVATTTNRSLFFATWGVTMETKKYAKKGQVAPYLNAAKSQATEEVVKEYIKEQAAAANNDGKHQNKAPKAANPAPANA